MKYGIVVCPKCKHVKAVNLVNKTTRCTRCNKILTIKKTRILFKTNSEIELHREIGKINKRLFENNTTLDR